MKWKLPKCCTASVMITATMAGFTGYSWCVFADRLAQKNTELAALEADGKNQTASLNEITAERDELLEIMVAQDGLIQSQTAALQNAKLDRTIRQAEIRAQAQKLAEMKAKLAAKRPQPVFRQPEKVGRDTANDVRRINRLWQK
jgi:hypothetical protein